jgi:hypothetical protein
MNILIVELFLSLSFCKWRQLYKHATNIGRLINGLDGEEEMGRWRIEDQAQ